ncbi:uncharacterized protein N7511_010312 [Penicillium nucicola]|uniref:uncharacterized protein n=1 Tax=Penicillium nucicola TaxID=1850975 RepID=UPI00254524AD|nr:uncharacterized protein N7511_010312 [Penicillium nucicola]KAJ5748616.1 hypothetical protein N7511_010312 [Penicillium nucicola]
MNPVSPFLAALAEQCLLFYLGRHSEDGIQAETQEGCVSFSLHRLVMSAIIDKWDQGDGDRATLTDSKNQIDAIFSRESLNEHEANFPCPSTIKDGPKRQLIELLDVKLALLYSTSSPEIELRVNRFRIRWDKVTKGEPPKPKLKKTPLIKNLIREACQRIQSASAGARPNGQADVVLAGPSISQFHQPTPPGSQVESMGSQLFSQVLPNANHDARRDNSKRNRVCLDKDTIIGLLRPSAALGKPQVDSYSPSLGVSNIRQSPSQNSSIPVESGAHSSHGLTNTPAEGACADEFDTESPHLNTSAHIADSMVIEKQPTYSSIGLVDRDETASEDIRQSQVLSKKRQRSSTGVPLQASFDDKDPQAQPKLVIQASANKRQRTDTGDLTPKDLKGIKEGLGELEPESVLSGVANVPMQDPSPDPWNGMTKISTNDVHIPKEQINLFEPLVWVQLGSSEPAPLCHVPPRLLSRWNDVAQRRKFLAEKEDQKIVHPVQTQQEEDGTESVADLVSQGSVIVSWPSSPERPPRKNLPSNSPPPSRKSRSINNCTPSGTQSSAYQTAEDGDVNVVNGSRAISQSAQEIDALQNALEIVAQRKSQPREESTIIPEEARSQSQGPGDNSSQEHVHSGLGTDDEEQEPTPIQEGQGGLRSESPPALSEILLPESSGDESDEAEMETCVPYGLGASIPPSSQPEQRMDSSGNSSGPSLLRPNMRGVQVVETPTIKMTRLRCEKEYDNAIEPEVSNTQRRSSQAANTSSETRILATYHSQEIYAQDDSSQKAPNSSLPIDGESLRVDVLGTQTQTSSLNPTSQETPQSHTEVVLNSSKTSRRQWDSSMFSSQPSANPSSIPFSSSHPQSMSQLNAPSQNSMREFSSLDGATYFPDTSLCGSSVWTAPDAESPSRSPKVGLNESIHDTEVALQNLNGELVARRQSFIDKPDETAQALMYYEKFCNDYQSYSGEFTHFVETCAKLQGLRDTGALKRSFLWDDFVILNLEDYPRHIEECASQESKALVYEDFFCSKFSRPRHKKRSLTTRAISVAASQFIPPCSTTLPNQPPSCPAFTSEGVDPSFRASIVDKLSDLHTDSFDNASASGFSADTSTNVGVLPATQPEVQVKLEQDIPSNGLSGSQAPTSRIGVQYPVLPSSEQDIVDLMQFDKDDIQVKHAMSDFDMSEADDSQEVYRTHHRTASIELGDDNEDRRSSHVSFQASPEASITFAAPAQHVQQEGQRPRPWFRSLRNIFPTGPVWSDDPNTPFKRWAREDQNVLQELNRRGGAKIQLDDKGVICRPTYKREQGPKSS